MPYQDDSELGVAELAALLSEREATVWAMLGEGCTNRVIAERLTLSEHTVKTHVTHVYRKLRVPSRLKAAQLYWQH